MVNHTNGGGETVTVNGIVYTVKAVDTVEDMAARGLAVAEMFKAEGRTRQMIATRPRGKREYLIIEWTAKRGGFLYRVISMSV